MNDAKRHLLGRILVETNIDGDPNIMTLLEAKEAYIKGLPIK